MANFLKGMYKPKEPVADAAAKAFDSGSAGRAARSTLLSMGSSFPKAPPPRPSSEAVRYGKGTK